MKMTNSVPGSSPNASLAHLSDSSPDVSSGTARRQASNQAPRAFAICRRNRLLTVSRCLTRLALLVALYLSGGALCSTSAQSFQVGIDFTTVMPRGEFNDNVDNNGYGVGGQFLYRLPRSPFLVGVDAAFANYGTERRRESLSSTIPELEIQVRTTNNIGWVHALLRAQPQTGRVRPYLDGLVGLKHFYTQTSINSDFSNETLAASTNSRDTALSYGIGGGVQIHLADLTRRSQIVLDTKLRYLRGGEAIYLRRGSIIREGGEVILDFQRSRTDVLSLQVGVTFRF